MTNVAFDKNLILLHYYFVNGFKKEEDARKEEEKQRKADAELRSYSNLMVEENMTSNRDGGNDSDDFM